MACCSIDEDISSKLEHLTFDRVDEAAALAAEAFLNSPAYCYIFDGLNDSARLDALRWFFSANFRLRLHTGASRCAFRYRSGPSPEMICFFMLQRPDDGKIGLLQMIRHGILLFPFKFGLRSFCRLLAMKEYHEKAQLQWTAAAFAKEGSRLNLISILLSHSHVPEHQVLPPGKNGCSSERSRSRLRE
jgi:hypothetical protein